MGTVGGNICLDTRCLYFNQTEFWRNALGYCLKKDGNSCHVIKNGKRCVAAASNDLATAFLACDATIVVMSPAGTLTGKLDEFYTAHGEHNKKLAHDQVVTSILVNTMPLSFGGFFKLRHRESIDFPMLSVATYFQLDKGNILKKGRVVINALVAKPKIIDLVDFVGASYHRETIEKIAQYAKDICHPQTNICDDPAWRKKMVAYSVKQAFNDARMVTE
jgi:4-hydroxybenzoyl-CoA reductase subunit beta